MTASILAIVASLLGLWGWWLKRKKAPTIDERLQDADIQAGDTMQRVKELFANGELRAAHDMLRRLNARNDWLLHGKRPKSGSGDKPNSNG